MPCRIPLTEAEHPTLEGLARNHSFRDFRPRALDVLALSKGHGLKVVADILGVTAQTVYNWDRVWRSSEAVWQKEFG
jgi:transposase